MLGKSVPHVIIAPLRFMSNFAVTLAGRSTKSSALGFVMVENQNAVRLLGHFHKNWALIAEIHQHHIFTGHIGWRFLVFSG